MTAIAVLAVVMAVAGWIAVRRVTDEPTPTDIAHFILTIPADEWREP